MTSVAWPLRPLGKCAKFLSGGTPSKARTDFWAGNIPWVSSGEMTELRIHDTPLHISEEGASNGSRLIPANTVLAVVRGMSLAKEFRVSITKREVAFNQDLKALACEPDIDSEFLFYALLARRDHIRALASEASHGTKRLETEVLSAFEIPVPKTMHAQHRVVAILSAYDDLIENNRRRMALVEEAARQLYREWFVCLRFPGHEHTRITDGIPEGWERKRFGEVLDHHIGGGWGQDEPQGSETEAGYVIRGTDIPEVEVGNFGTVGLRYHDPRRLRQRVLQPGDIIFEVSGGSATQAIGRTLLVTGELLRPLQPRVICASFCKLFRVANPILPFFLLRWLRHIRESGDLSVFQKQSASALQNFQYQPFLEEQDVLLPTQVLLKEFCSTQADLLRQQQTLGFHNHKLRAARDLLLPRLMSGDIVG